MKWKKSRFAWKYINKFLEPYDHVQSQRKETDFQNHNLRLSVLVDADIF